MDPVIRRKGRAHLAVTRIPDLCYPVLSVIRCLIIVKLDVVPALVFNPVDVPHQNIVPSLSFYPRILTVPVPDRPAVLCFDDEIFRPRPGIIHRKYPGAGKHLRIILAAGHAIRSADDEQSIPVKRKAIVIEIHPLHDPVVIQGLGNPRDG